MMHRMRRVGLSAALAAALAALACREPSEGLVLTMPSDAEIEAAKKRSVPESEGGTTLSAILLGPAIAVLKPPKDEEITSPFAVDVRFEPRAGADVDLSSLSLCAVVGWMCIYRDELTEAIRPFATVAGISHPHVEIDRTGSFKLRLSIGDTVGGSSSATFQVQLK